MAEYIEREAALNASKIVYIEYLETDDEGYIEADCDYIPVVLKRDIMALPAADVKPVVHGHWIVDRECGNDVMSGEKMVICSVCGKGVFYGKTHYCPNCGAQMDKETTDI